MKKLLLTTAFLALTAGAAFAADLPSRKAAPILPPPPPPPLWSGFYAGLNAGYGFGTSNTVTTASGALVDAWNYPGWNAGSTLVGATALANAGVANVKQNGFIGGGQLGYNYQWGPSVVIGLEADMQGAGISGSGSSFGIAPTSQFSNWWDSYPYRGPAFNAIGVNNVTAGINWMGTVRGRLGYLFTPTLLVYATGGLTYGGVHASVNNQIASATLSYRDGYTYGMPTFGIGQNKNQVNVGWNVGGGLEWMFMPNWSVKAEAFYYNLGSLNVAGATGIKDGDCYGDCPRAGGAPYGNVISNFNVQSTRVSYQGVVARAGVNYHFNWAAAAPVVAKY